MAAAMSAVNPLSSLNGFAAAAPMFATPTPAAAPSPLQFAAAQSATPTSADMRLFAQQTLAAGGMPLLGAGPANSVASAAAAANSAAAAADSMKIPGVDFHKAFADATHAMFHHQAQQQAQQQQEKRDPAAAAARQLGIQDDTSSLQAAAAKRQRLNSMSGLDVFSQQQYQNHVKQAQMMQMAQLQTQLQMQQRLQQQQFLGGLGMYPGSMMPGECLVCNCCVVCTIKRHAVESVSTRSVRGQLNNMLRDNMLHNVSHAAKPCHSLLGKHYKGAAAVLA